MSNSPSSDQGAAVDSSIRPNAAPEKPLGIKAVAWLLVAGAVLDVVVGLVVVEATPVLGVLLLGLAVTEVYLAYGLWHRQRWAHRGTIALQLSLGALQLLVGQTGPPLLKAAIALYLLAVRDADWR